MKISEEGEKNWGMEKGNKQIKTTKLHRYIYISNVFCENLLSQDLCNLKFANMFQPLCFDRKVYTFPASHFLYIKFFTVVLPSLSSCVSVVLDFVIFCDVQIIHPPFAKFYHEAVPQLPVKVLHRQCTKNKVNTPSQQRQVKASGDPILKM